MQFESCVDPKNTLSRELCITDIESNVQKFSFSRCVLVSYHIFRLESGSNILENYILEKYIFQTMPDIGSRIKRIISIYFRKLLKITGHARTYIENSFARTGMACWNTEPSHV